MHLLRIPEVSVPQQRPKQQLLRDERKSSWEGREGHGQWMKNMLA